MMGILNIESNRIDNDDENTIGQLDNNNFGDNAIVLTTLASDYKLVKRNEANNHT